jgi:hypothetical protein
MITRVNKRGRLCDRVSQQVRLPTLPYALHVEDALILPGRADYACGLTHLFPLVIAQLVGDYASGWERGCVYRREENLGRVLVAVALDDGVEVGLFRKSRNAKRVRAWLRVSGSKTEFFLRTYPRSALEEVHVFENRFNKAAFDLWCGQWHYNELRFRFYVLRREGGILR